MWKRGVIEILDETGKYVNCHYSVKYLENLGSRWTINKGKISKLQIKIDDVVVCDYDLMWNIKPINKPAEQAFEILLKEYN